MKICFLGISHAAQHLSAAAAEKGFLLVGLNDDPALVFVSEDTPTNVNGLRNVVQIRNLFMQGKAGLPVPIILTSQVPPGFTRSLKNPGIFTSDDEHFWVAGTVGGVFDAQRFGLVINTWVF